MSISAVFARLKNDPYWISLIPQGVMFLVILGTWQLGTPFLLIVLASIFYFLFGRPIRKVRATYEAAVAADPARQFKVENFHYRMPRRSPWLPEKFDDNDEAERAKDPYFDFWVYLFH